MKKKKFLEILGGITMGFISVIFIFFLIMEAEKIMALYPKEKELYILFIIIIVAYFAYHIQILIHELGHLVFGKLSGYKFSSIRLGSIMLIKKRNKYKIKTLKIIGTGGQCIMNPPELDENDDYPATLYNLGGSLLNLIVSSILIAIAIIINENNFTTLILKVFSYFGFYFAALNGIPIKAGMIDNDGYNAVSLNKDKQAKKAFWIQLKTNQLLNENKRLKEMPEELFKVDKDADLTNNLIATQAAYECNLLMDKHEFTKANKKMKELLKKETSLVGVHQNLLICDMIYCELIEGDLKKAEKLYTNDLKNFMKSMKDFPSIIRTNYVISLILEKNEEKAKQYQKDFYQRAKTYPYQSDIASEKELIAIARKTIEK